MNQKPLPTKTINLPAELHRQLKMQAAIEGKTLQELIIETLAAALGLDIDNTR